MSTSVKDRLLGFATSILSAVVGACVVLFAYAKAEGRDGHRLDVAEALAIRTSNRLDEEHDSIVKMGKDIEALMKHNDAIRALLEGIRRAVAEKNR